MAFLPQPPIARGPARRLDPIRPFGQRAAMSARGLFRNRDFRLLFAGASATNLGDGVMMVAMPWLATLLTRDPFLIGLVAMARHLPWVLLALPVGVLTDRLDHRRTLLACDTLRAGLMLASAALALLAMPGTAAVLALACLAFFLGSAEVLRDNTAQTLLPRVVAHNQLEDANGFLWATEQVAGQFLGPPLAGLLIAVAVALPFGLNAAMLAGSVALTAAMALPRQVPEVAPMRFGPAMKQGLRFLWAHPVLRPMAFALGAFNFIGAAFFALLVLYAQEVLHLSAAGYGLLLSAAAAGGLAGSLIGPRILRRIGSKAGLMAGLAGFVATAAILALGPPVWAVAAALVLEAFTNMLWNLTSVSYRQRHIPPALLGRVNAVYRFFGTGPSAFGALAGGALVALAAGPLGIVDALRLPYALCLGLGLLILAYVALRVRIA